jgi:hypothetical protein
MNDNDKQLFLAGSLCKPTSTGIRFVLLRSAMYGEKKETRRLALGAIIADVLFGMWRSKPKD